MEVIKQIQSFGFTVLVVLTDGNKLNQKLFSHLTMGEGCELNKYFPNPDRDGKLIFVKYDTVHLFKNIRNNWINQKDDMKSFLYPSWENFGYNNFKLPKFCHASFKEIRLLYRSQSASLLKTGYRLNYQSVYVNNFNRQRVSLVDNVFHDSTIAAMAASGYEETSDFMKIIRRWWDMNNVHSYLLGQKLLNDDAKPFSRETVNSDERFKWLQQFLQWLKLWNESSEADGHKLTNDTGRCLIQSTEVFLMIVPYLFENYPECKFVLSGRLQTDELERRFGKYRQLCGGNYKVSVNDILKSERKMRNRTLTKLVCHGRTSLKEMMEKPADENEVEVNDGGDLSRVFDFDFMTNLEGVDADDINYISGAVASKIAKKHVNGCQSCAAKLYYRKGKF